MIHLGSRRNRVPGPGSVVTIGSKWPPTDQGRRGHTPLQLVGQSPTFEGENFVPSRVEVLSLDVRRERVLLVGQQRDLDVRIRRAAEVLRRQLLGSDDLDRQRLRVEVVRHAEVDLAELFLSRAAAARRRLVPGEGWVSVAPRRTGEPIIEVAAARQPTLNGQLGQRLTELWRSRLQAMVRLWAGDLSQQQQQQNKNNNSNVGHVISANMNDRHAIMSRRNSVCEKLKSWIIYCVIFGSVIRLSSWGCCVTSVVIFMAVLCGIYRIQVLSNWVLPGVKAWDGSGVCHTGRTILRRHLCVVCCLLTTN